MKLSIVTPFYNGYDVFDRVLESYIEQKRKQHHDMSSDEIEWIVINDGSDETVDYDYERHALSSGVTRWINKERGWRNNWNDMQRLYLEECSGEYIMVHEQDHLFINGLDFVKKFIDFCEDSQFKNMFLKYNYCESVAWYQDLLIGSFLSSPMCSSVGAEDLACAAGCIRCRVFKCRKDFYFMPQIGNDPTPSVGVVGHAEFIAHRSALEDVYSGMGIVDNVGHAEGEFIRSFVDNNKNTLYLNQQGFSVHIGVNCGYEDKQNNDVTARMKNKRRYNRFLDRAKIGIGPENFLFLDNVAISIEKGE
jgi:glycosyltransferase involved in cell wall biosynthesis